MRKRTDSNQLLIDWSARPAASVAAIRPAAPLERAPKPKRRRGPASFPKPTPLQDAIKKGNFGEEDGEPVSPRREEVYSITLALAERLIELYTRLWHDPKNESIDGQIKSGLAMYAEDFGEAAANQMEAYCRHHSEQANRSR